VGHIAVDANPTSTDSCNNIAIQNVIVRSTNHKRFSIPITIESENTTETTTALVDCGAEGLFVDISIAHKWRKQKLARPIKVRNVDGSFNKEGEIKERCLITFDCNGRKLTEWFCVTAIGNQNLILGLPWLEKHNPIIDWKEKTLEFRDSDKDIIRTSIRSLCLKIDDEEAMPEQDEEIVIRYIKSQMGPELADFERWLNGSIYENDQWIEEMMDPINIRRFSPAQQMEHKYHRTEEEVMLPPEYTKWKKVFEKKASERFPERRPWDHAIELKEDFRPKRGKIYNLSPLQQKSLNEWIKEQLGKGYIR
jgi:hypothetical protein